MVRAAQHSSRNRSSDWHSKAMKLASRCGAPWPSGSINYADRLNQIASAENCQASKPPWLAPRANKERHPCKARRRRPPGARAWAPAGVRRGEPQECQRVSVEDAAPWSEPARPVCVRKDPRAANDQLFSLPQHRVQRDCRRSHSREQSRLVLRERPLGSCQGTNLGSIFAKKHRVHRWR